MNILIINGPNLNLLGKREPEIYGSLSFEAYLEGLQRKFIDHKIEYYQSNVEGEIIDKLHDFGFGNYGIILNAGGYSHTSVAISDAVAAIKSPVVEVHISNVFAPEEYRHHSLITKNCKGMIVGLGLEGYKLAVSWLIEA